MAEKHITTPHEPCLPFHPTAKLVDNVHTASRKRNRLILLVGNLRLADNLEGQHHICRKSTHAINLEARNLWARPAEFPLTLT